MSRVTDEGVKLAICTAAEIFGPASQRWTSQTRTRSSTLCSPMCNQDGTKRADHQESVIQRRDYAHHSLSAVARQLGVKEEITHKAKKRRVTGTERGMGWPQSIQPHPQGRGAGARPVYRHHPRGQ